MGLACSAKERIASLKEKGREPRADHDESDWDDESDSEVEEEENIEEKGETQNSQESLSPDSLPPGQTKFADPPPVSEQSQHFPMVSQDISEVLEHLEEIRNEKVEEEEKVKI